MKFLNCPKIILLSGTPGTGKSTISSIITQNLNWPVFNLGDFIIERNLYENEDNNEGIKNIKEEKAAIECVLELYRICLKKINSLSMINNETIFNPIVVDSHYADIILDGIRIFNQNPKFYNEKIELSSFDNETTSCISQYSDEKNIIGIILRCKPSELEDRLNKRDYSTKKIEENLQAEILGESTSNMLEVFAEEKIYEIDTSAYGKSECCNIIKEIIGDPEFNRKKFGCGTINWMGILAQEGKLKDYFKNKLGLNRIITDFKDEDNLGK